MWLWGIVSLVLSLLYLFSRFPTGSGSLQTGWSKSKWIKLGIGTTRYVLTYQNHNESVETKVSTVDLTEKCKVVPDHIIIMIHGLTTHLDIWTLLNIKQLPNTAVLKYDILGHGGSQCAPNVPLTNATFVHQLEELLDALGLQSTPITLIGHSMGGDICTCYAAAHPEYVKSLVLISSIPEKLPLAPILAVPWLRDVIIKILFKKGMKKRYASKRSEIYQRVESAKLSNNDYKTLCTLFDSIESQLTRNPYFLRSVSNTLQHISPTVSRLALQKLIQSKPRLPLLYIWGDQDTSSTYSNGKQLLSMTRTLAVHGTGETPSQCFFTIHGGSHLCLYESPVEISEALSQFLDHQTISPDACAY